LITFIGHFVSASTKQIGGQHIRTEMVYQLLCDRYRERRIAKIDTASQKVRAILHLFFSAKGVTVLLPGRNLLFSLCVLRLLRPARLKTLVVVAIGGWLPRETESSPVLLWTLKGIRKIHVQLPSMQKRLSALGVVDVYVLPNFRSYDAPSRKILVNPTPKLRFIFLSRVCREKGVVLAVDAIAQRKDESVLDIYGPVAKSFEGEFFQLLKQNPRVRYKGEVPNYKVLQILSGYDILLFPSSYPGEGFPGILLEASYAGIYCVSSDHLYNREVSELYCRGEVVSLSSFKDRVANISSEEVEQSRPPSVSAPLYSELVRTYCLL
jgi:glycosyltransferase involved in cell wall biosynthesis